MMSGRFRLPDQMELLRELRTLVAGLGANRTQLSANHASNYFAHEGRLPRDRERLLATIDQALGGDLPLKPEIYRAL